MILFEQIRITSLKLKYAIVSLLKYKLVFIFFQSHQLCAVCIDFSLLFNLLYPF